MGPHVLRVGSIPGFFAAEGDTRTRPLVAEFNDRVREGADLL
jgi:hypothetical protein